MCRNSPLPNANSLENDKHAFIMLSIGDCKAFHIKEGHVRDLTAGAVV